jgi:hypothetical protein
MATIKIILDPHETEEEAQELLLKALTANDNGDAHVEAFHQPAAREVFEQMERKHDEMWREMMEEIFLVLEEET